MINSSLTCICDTRNDHFLSIFGHIIIHIRPNRFLQNWWILWVSRWSEGMKYRVHRRKIWWWRTNSAHTWFIYWTICPICRRMSNFQSNDHLTSQRSKALYLYIVLSIEMWTSDIKIKIHVSPSVNITFRKYNKLIV